MNVETPIFIIVAVYDSDFKIFLLNKKPQAMYFNIILMCVQKYCMNVQ